MKRVMYLRDSNYRPVGAVVITVDRTKNRAEYQLSTLNPVDKFDRKTARFIAMERLLDDPITVSIPKEASMHDVSKAVMEHLANSKAPTRAVKGARYWLRFVSDVFD